LVPVGERVDLEHLVALGPLHLGRARATRRLVAADARDPRVVGFESADERLDLADLAAAIRVALPQVRALGAMLLRDRGDLRPDEPQLVALDEPVAGLVRLAKEQVCVE